MTEDRKKCSSLSIPLISAFMPYDIWFDNAWYHLYCIHLSIQHPSPAQEVRNLKEETCDTGLVQRSFLGNLKHQSTSSWPSTFFCFTINKLQSWRVFTLFASLKLSSYILHQWILSVLQFSFFACLVLLQSFGKCWMHLAPGRSTLTCLSGAGEQPSNGCQWRWGVLADSGISVPLLRGMKSDSTERGDSIICLNTTSTNQIAQPFPQW